MNIPTYQELEDKVLELAVQLANAESKCRELAAENENQKTHSEALAVDNAALREVVERMVNQFAMSGISPEEKSINPAKSLMFDAKLALFMPATDALLAEVRSSTIRDALDESSDYLNTDCVMDRLDISYEDAELRTSGAIELHDALVAVANQLRKGE
ncbi:hypothetical protein [Citrobacter freundii]|uniref:hypothetical protein n=1 Tax=Citrobacter freundii TaxID=546 RepID=UPI00237C1F57|nr:hypothetical protein [Citrobacter freundii]MDH0219039.1 hypothetical protein [Citrobacter freundii]MDH0987077.1 hypothetical protein [Citrobacter freundii]MDH1383541.1 hypothetical protein [Citrobacter freundii]MDH1908906.1 hypothetical protein [Citrobacter freundii]MDQ9164020.1 hypothetical protein [Citrobacter freundii]